MDRRTLTQPPTGLRIERQLPDAVIFHDPATAGIPVAAMSLLDRWVVSAHRAGAPRITIVSPVPIPPLRRSHAWNIGYTVVDDPPGHTGPALVGRTNCLVHTSDLKRLLHHGPGRLATPAGIPLDAALVPSAPPDAFPDLNPLPTLEAAAVAAPVANLAEARTAEKLLWSSLASSSDGLVDRHFNRPCGRPLSKLLIHSPVSPNQISVLSILIGLAGAAMLALGSWGWAVVGAVVFQISAIVDCVDGDVARAVFKESPLGKWLDIAGDQVVHAAVFAGIAVGLWRGGIGASALWLGLSAVLGGLLSFAVVLRGMAQGGGGDSLLRRLVDAATNRDFSVLVLLLALAGRLDWFLWMAALGSHLFWVTALVVQMLPQPKETVAS